MIADRTGDYHLTGYSETGITVSVGYAIDGAKEGDMYGSLSREVADLRARDLRRPGGASRRPRGARGWRHRLGLVSSSREPGSPERRPGPSRGGRRTEPRG